LRSAVDKLVNDIKAINGTVGVAIVDVGTGELLAAHGEHRALNPASNAKLLTAAAALFVLGPNHKYVTGLYGQQKGANVAQLVLRGTGDPSLSTADLWELSRSLKESGVKRIDGDILVDQRFFDDQFVPPAYDQQPSEWAPFRANVTAVSLNENTVTMTVRPGQKGGAASVSFDPPGFVDVEGSVKTAESGAAQNIRLTLSGSGTRLKASIGGSIPEDSKQLSFTKRADNPTLLAGYALKAILTQSGIAVGGEVKAGEGGRGGAIASHTSKPLSTLLYELGKVSDNFYAEMVFKSLGLEKKGRPAKAANAAEIVTRYLEETGAMEEGDVVKNGSGLFDANRVTALTLTKVLRTAYRDPAYGNEYVAQLSIGGVDGTLRHRFRGAKQKRVVRAKTGTLEGAASLSGYVLAPDGGQPIAFSILVNGVAGKVGDARQAMDKCVNQIVNHLWKD
jgi:serine-type D-Ala-D-Ala carboxypeptidase/endopeptidase (penicillin-binding protein 4)